MFTLILVLVWVFSLALFAKGVIESLERCEGTRWLTLGLLLGLAIFVRFLINTLN